MSVVIRLARGGRKKSPFYAIVVANSRAPRDGKFIEKVGTYNPMLPRDDANRVTLVTERLQHWLTVGAQPSDRVASFLAKAGLMKARIRAEQTKQDKPKAKAQERVREQEAAKEAAAAAEIEAKETAKREAEEAKAAAEAAANAPKEEPVAEAPAEDAAPEAVAEEAPAAEAAADEAPKSDDEAAA